MNVHTLDLHFLGYDDAIAVYVVETSEGLVLIESGPHSTFLSLRTGLNIHGWKISDVKHVLLTHIHFDHAGAAWALAQAGARVYVHPAGYPHLLAPEKLYDSARRIYGEDMERLWGEMQPIPESNLQAMEHGQTLHIGELDFTAWFTPGHAQHHLAWECESTIFSGDVAGVAIQGGPAMAPCPPPDIDLAAWKNSIGLLRSRNAQRLFLTHFGEITHVQQHLTQLEAMLEFWVEWMRGPFEANEPPEEITPRFQAFATNQLRELGVSAENLPKYEAANPAFMSVAGLLRYWKLKSQGRLQ